MEADSRSQGQALDDLQVRRMSSFVRSYGEMQRGEEFVMREVRVRARERIRWGAGAGLLAIALLMMPGAVGRLWSAISHSFGRCLERLPGYGRSMWTRQ